LAECTAHFEIISKLGEKAMSLMDVLNGMRNGPGGQVGGAPSLSGGMSPITMGVLAYLAYKAFKGGGMLSPATNPANKPSSDYGGDWLGGLTKAIAGGAGGSILTGGLGELFKRLQQSGHGPAAQSWVGTGPNQSISPSALEKALGPDTLDELTRKTGMTREHLLETLSREMPATIDRLTPDGRLPNEQEAARWTS
jgi:uncharacterized protein YidB (DUF937 family)